MIKIGNASLLFIAFCFWLAALPNQTIAQPEIEVDATVSESTAYTGERLRLTIEITGDFNNVSRPDLPDFNDIEGIELLSSNASTSRQFQVVNGEMSTSYSYSYYIAGESAGNYQIPPITVTVDGEEFETDPIDLQVVDRNEDPDQDSDDSDEMFLELNVSDVQPVPGQQLIVDVNLYFKDGIQVQSYQPVPGWKTEGFWKEELENSSRPQAESAIVNGVRYRKARLLQFALFPTKTGDLTISPYEVAVTASSSSQRRDSFFGSFGSRQRKVELASEPININVQPLPLAGDALSFGAVGDFDLQRSVDSREVMAGESIEVTTTIEGAGNIPLISKPNYSFPDGLERYSPRENSDINRRQQLIQGTKTFTDVLVAQQAGSYSIPETEVAYYNPDANEYVRETLPAIELEVTENPEAASDISESTSFDLAPTTGLARWMTPTDPNPYRQWWLWAGLIFPLLILGGAYWRKKYLEKIQNDTAFARSKKADHIANTKLQQAIKVSEKGDVKEAYSLLHKALTGFIADRVNLPKAGLSNSDYVEVLKKRNADPNLVKNVEMLLEKCATISYAPNTTHEYLRSHVGLTQSILNKLKKEL